MFLDPADNDKRHTTNDQTAGFDVSVLITEVRYIYTPLLFGSSSHRVVFLLTSLFGSVLVV